MQQPNQLEIVGEQRGRAAALYLRGSVGGKRCSGRNLKDDPILVPVSAAMIARARAQPAGPGLIPPFVHEVLEFPSPGNRKIRR